MKCLEVLEKGRRPVTLRDVGKPLPTAMDAEAKVNLSTKREHDKLIIWQVCAYDEPVGILLSRQVEFSIYSS